MQGRDRIYNLVILAAALVAWGVVWFIVARVLKLASVGTQLCAVLFPVLVALAGYGAAEVAVIAALAVVVIVRHAANLQRLFQGREHRTGEGGARPDRPA